MSRVPIWQGVVYMYRYACLELRHFRSGLCVIYIISYWIFAAPPLPQNFTPPSTPCHADWIYYHASITGRILLYRYTSVQYVPIYIIYTHRYTYNNIMLVLYASSEYIVASIGREYNKIALSNLFATSVVPRRIRDDNIIVIYLHVRVGPGEWVVVPVNIVLSVASGCGRLMRFTPRSSKARAIVADFTTDDNNIIGRRYFATVFHVSHSHEKKRNNEKIQKPGALSRRRRRSFQGRVWQWILYNIATMVWINITLYLYRTYIYTNVVSLSSDKNRIIRYNNIICVVVHIFLKIIGKYNMIYLNNTTKRRQNDRYWITCFSEP